MIWMYLIFKNRKKDYPTFEENDLNVLFNPSFEDTGKGFPKAKLILLLLTTKLSVNFCNLSVLKGNFKISPTRAK